MIFLDKTSNFSLNNKKAAAYLFRIFAAAHYNTKLFISHQIILHKTAFYGILHKNSNSHRTDTTGNGSNF